MNDTQQRSATPHSAHNNTAHTTAAQRSVQAQRRVSACSTILHSASRLSVQHYTTQQRDLVSCSVVQHYTTQQRDVQHYTTQQRDLVSCSVVQHYTTQQRDLVQLHSGQQLRLHSNQRRAKLLTRTGN
jgi:hypothetical protein